MQMGDLEPAKELYSKYFVILLLFSNFQFCCRQGKEIQGTIFLGNNQIQFDNYQLGNPSGKGGTGIWDLGRGNEEAWHASKKKEKNSVCSSDSYML